MACPVCKSKVRGVRGTVDAESLLFCDNPACDWMSLPEDRKERNALTLDAPRSTTRLTEAVEREYHGQTV